MKYLLIILLCSCTTTKTFVLDSSESQGNLVKREWFVNGFFYDEGISTRVTVKKSAKIDLIVTDDKKRKDTAITTIK